MKRTYRPLISLGMVMGSLALSITSAHTHNMPVERGIVVQMSKTQASVLVSYQDPKAARAKVIYKRYDINGDGQLNDKEAKLAAKMLLPIALQGLQLEIPGFRPSAHAPKIKVKRSKKGELMMLALVNYTLPTWKKASTRQFKVSLKGTQKYPPIQVSYIGVEGVKLVQIEPAKQRLLRPGQTSTATFKLAEATPAKKLQKK